jgi:hypothetical protein
MEENEFKFKCEKCEYYTNFKSSYDKHKLTERVPDNLRWFSMDIWIAETRNMRYTLPGAVGNLTNNTRIGGFTNSIVNTASTITSSFGNVDPTSTVEQFGYVKFKCRQCEFDFSKSFPQGNTSSMSIETGNIPSTSQFTIKIGYPVYPEKQMTKIYPLLDVNFCVPIKCKIKFVLKSRKI